MGCRSLVNRGIDGLFRSLLNDLPSNRMMRAVMYGHLFHCQLSNSLGEQKR